MLEKVSSKRPTATDALKLMHTKTEDNEQEPVRDQYELRLNDFFL